MANMTLAEKSFRNRVKEGVKECDWDKVSEAFFMYGTYLELVGGDGPAENQVTIVWPAPAIPDISK